jgi:hypothetical protein
LVLFFCALLAIVLSIPLYGYALVSFFVLYWPLYCLSLYTAMFWHHLLCFIDHCIVCPFIRLCFGIMCCALLAFVLSVPLYGYGLVSFIGFIGHFNICPSA